MKSTKAGILYFALVFGAGFALGPIRVLWLVPRVGDRAAELIEAPIMLAVMVLAARAITRRLAVSAAASARLAMGLTGLALMLAAEFGLVLWLRGITLQDYFAGRDPVAALVYYALLGVFALTPLLLAAMKGRDRTD
ncbi:MAG TPA: hypothetical protein PK042_04090 [Usitatibacteraceae bacterium]|nr:hypothetical protein [Usitatibacteraceae bacterium]